MVPAAPSAQRATNHDRVRTKGLPCGFGDSPAGRLATEEIGR